MQVRVLKGWKSGGYVKCGKIWKVERPGLNPKDRAVMMAVVMMVVMRTMMRRKTMRTMRRMMTMMMTMTTMMTMRRMMMMTTRMMTFGDGFVRKKVLVFFSHLCASLKPKHLLIGSTVSHVSITATRFGCSVEIHTLWKRLGS